MTYREISLDVGRPLAAALVTLAQTPDEACTLHDQLLTIVQLATERVEAADFASVTALRDGALTTVAASGEIARAIDQVQYGDEEGPCVQAFRDEVPHAVPAVAATMRWPGFRREALRWGLHASVSVPLFVASGKAAAILNLHSRDDAAMAPLIAGVWSIYDPDRRLPYDDNLRPVGVGGQEMLDGFAGAVQIRATIQRALHTIMNEEQGTAVEAYWKLSHRATRHKRPILEMARTLLASQVPEADA
ncbi:GAF domain-containing protein [Actinoplanes sp. URMC 104]|uniref:GAF domain-containing protein n=1 Tax=Actinoplanes sp. URMC 104 TaxID=3423409 RepID=UPI003F1B5D7B